MVDMRELPFGVEIEFTGITRKKAARICAAFFGSTARESGDNWYIGDAQGRDWKLCFDGSVLGEPDSEMEYENELVTPICRYEDIPLLQDLLLRLRDGGLNINRSCGLHIHVDGSRFDARTLRNLVNLVASKEDMIYRALNVDAERAKWYCKKTDETFLRELNQRKPKDLEEFRRIWYGDMQRGIRHNHYDGSRYVCLNLHSFFEKGTVEYRVFNGTAQPGRLKTAIQFVLAITAQSLNQQYARMNRTQSENEKYTFRTWLLRLGLIGDEFQTARRFLLENLEGNSAWRDPAQAEAQRERLRQAVLQADMEAEQEEQEDVQSFEQRM